VGWGTGRGGGWGGGVWGLRWGGAGLGGTGGPLRGAEGLGRVSAEAGWGGVAGANKNKPTQKTTTHHTKNNNKKTHTFCWWFFGFFIEVVGVCVVVLFLFVFWVSSCCFLFVGLVAWFFCIFWFCLCAGCGGVVFVWVLLLVVGVFGLFLVIYVFFFFFFCCVFFVFVFFCFGVTARSARRALALWLRGKPAENPDSRWSETTSYMVLISRPQWPALIPVMGGKGAYD